MPLISSSVPNLNGGVSQQPATQRLPNQCEEQENAVPLLVGGLVKRPPTNHIAELKEVGGASVNMTGCFTHFVSRDETERFVVSITGDPDEAGEGTKGVRVHDLAGNAKTVYVANTVADAYLTSDNPEIDFRAVTIGDVTFLLNRSITAAMDSSTSASTTDAFPSLVWIKSTQQGIKFTVKVGSSSVTFNHTPVAYDATGAAGENAMVFHPDPPSTSAIAQSLALGTGVPTDSSVTANGINGIADVTASNVGSVIYIYKAADYTLTCEDSIGQNGHSIVKDSVQSFSDLPKIAKNGMKVLVEGDPEAEVDDYYVKFEQNGGGTGVGEGIWVEDIAPGLEYKFDYNTMPLILVRQPDGTFMVTRADGLTPTDNAHADVDWTLYKFAERESGSNLTNPLPSFVGRKIKDIAYFKNRLVFASGEDCALSEAAELFNFFRTTTTLLLDTAPVDVGAGGTEVNSIERTVPFSGSLVLFSEKTQFSMVGEGILSPLTASVNPATNFDAITNASPITVGNSMLFAFNRGNFSGIREFYKTNAVDINFDAFDITTQVPKYIKGEIRKMVPSSQEDMVIVLAREKSGSDYTATDTLYLYKYYKSGTDRLQSAWCKFSFSNATVIDINIVGESMYLILLRNGKTFLERMDLQNGLVDTDSNYVTTIDRRVLYTVSDGPTKTLSNIGYDIVSGDTMQVVSTDGELMTIDTAVAGGQTIVLEEEVADDTQFYIGTQYTMRYELTPPTLRTPREGGGFTPLTVGRHQLRYMNVSYDETATFVIRVTPKIGGAYGTSIEYPFTGRFLSAGGYLGSVPSESGDFRFPVFAESDSVKIEVLNSSPLPSNIQSFEFEAFYTSRSQPSR